MSLELQIQRIVQRATEHGHRFATAESTFQGLVLPLLQALGYDVFDPDVLTPVHSQLEGEVWHLVRLDDAPWLFVACRPLNHPLSDATTTTHHATLRTLAAQLALATDGAHLDFCWPGDGGPFKHVTLEDASPHLANALSALGAERPDVARFESLISAQEPAAARWNQVELVDFGPHHRTTLNLGRLTVLVGPNGTGKTTVLRALMALGRGLHGQAWSPQLDPSLPMRSTDPRLWRMGTTVQWALKASVGTRYLSFSYNITGTVPDYQTGGNPVRPPLPRYLHLRAETLAQPVQSNSPPTTMAASGQGLVAMISSLILHQPAVFEQILEMMREVFPDLVRIRVERQGNGSFYTEHLRFDLKGVRDLSAEMVSEGMLIVLGILTAVYIEPRTNLLLLDNLEQGLHPAAQLDLIKQLRTVLRWVPELQIVATTHSPYLVDALEPAEVYVLVRASDGGVTAHCLADHPRKDMLAYLSTGEFWSQEGYQWDPM